MKNEPKNLPTKVSESVRKLNPHLYAGNLVGSMEPKVRKQDKVAALASRPPRSKTGADRAEYVITLCNHRRVLIDDDNLIGGLKSLRDSIANRVSVDDGDPRIRWQYHQIESKGREGVVVTIEKI